jgi:hypothetical protein
VFICVLFPKKEILMRKAIWLLLFLLVACGPTTNVSDETARDTEAQPDNTEIQEDTAVSGPDLEIPTARTIAEATLLREREWVEGAEDPIVVIIEYGDFQ